MLNISYQKLAELRALRMFFPEIPFKNGIKNTLPEIYLACKLII
jgi:hypothetical protein